VSHARQLLTADQLADALAISLSTVRRMTRDGQIPFIRVRSLLRYDLLHVLDCLGVRGNGNGGDSGANGLDGW